MADIRKVMEIGGTSIIIQTVDGDIDTTHELETAIINSIFTWRRARADDVLPYEGDDRQGWWGDTYPFVEDDEMGSRLWLLLREKLTTRVLQRALEYVRESLEWLIEDGVASDVQVTGEIQQGNRIAMAVTIIRGTQTDTLRFDFVWTEILGTQRG